MIMRASLPPGEGGVSVRGPGPGTGGFPCGGRELSARGAGTATRRSGVSGDAPPILFSLSCQRKENAPCTVEEKRERFRRLRRPHSSIEGRSADLTRGRMDVLLFPRFAPSRARLGGIPLLLPRKAPACAQAQKEGVDGCKFLRFLVADCEVGLQTIFQQ